MSELVVFRTPYDADAGFFELPLGATKTIFENCCLSTVKNFSQQQQSPSTSCNFKVYCGVITINHEYERDNNSRILMALFYLGTPVQLDCAPDGITIQNGHAHTFLISSPFDKITLTAIASDSGGESAAVKGNFFYSLGISTSGC
ncbi:MAG: hypothetical protein RLZ12_940 [Bacillota bacterium]|jgi:hypothetical protein